MVEFKMTEEERKKFDVVDDLKRAVFNLRTEIESKGKKHASLIKMASKNLAQLCKQAGHITELEKQRDELEDTLKEQVETAYRAGIEDGWMNPEGNMDNMTYEYMKYLEAK